MISCRSLLPTLLLAVTINAQLHNDEAVIRWASTGGGWRSMFACMGFGYVFQQAGVLDDDHSHFTAVSTNSGGSWFSTQAFYSPEFYAQTVMAESPEDVQAFALKWMESYLNVAKDFESNPICDITDLIGGASNTTDGNSTDTSAIDPLLQTFSEFCDMLLAYEGDWTAFMEDMIAAAAADYGDPDLASRIVNPDNRIFPLQQTDLLVQSAVLANSRIRGELVAVNGTTEEMDVITHLGPSAGQSINRDDIYSLTLSAAYTVNSTYSGFQYNKQDTRRSTDLGLFVEEGSSPEFDFETYDDSHFLYPPSPNATVTTPTDTPPSGGMRPAFGGPSTTNVVQIASVSSAALGSFSPLAPSTFAQSLSKMRAAVAGDPLAVRLFDKAADRLYKSPLLDKFAVCSQWPNPCTSQDGLFIDGGLVDNAAIPINIAQYHNSERADLERVLKIVVTNNNDQDYNAWGSDRMTTQILQYFDSSINEGIAPGDFVWYEALPLPFRSPQIFQESMDFETLDSLMQPIEGTTFTTAQINVTTVDNPAFGIKAGQEVQLLWINLNSPVTTFIVGKTIIEETTEPVGQMVYDIASNEELTRQVKDFFHTHKDPKKPATDSGNTSDEGTSSESTSSAAVRGGVADWASLVLLMLAGSLLH